MVIKRMSCIYDSFDYLFCLSMKGLDLGLGLELFYRSLFWALLGPTWVDPIPFRDELGFFRAQCLIGQ